ncbi:MAG TPA: hypothetical protein VKS24_08420 [Bradyrhizobium sp.]|nr:hypothetical protein [Bradyrhizobium sp.]
MITLFAFLHHLCAFTLVSAVAIEFVLIRSELNLSSVRRLQVINRCTSNVTLSPCVRRDDSRVF